MAINMKYSSIFFLLFLPLLASCVERQVYVVYLGGHHAEKALHEIEEAHYSYLLKVKETEVDARASLLYSYKHGMNGFAAVLTRNEASRLLEMDEVVSVIRSDPAMYSLHTTRSWDFSGLEEAAPPEQLGKDDLLVKANYGRDVIVGHVDSGLWPESESFNDADMGPIPESWKGVCQTGDSFTESNCNKKIIGARYYLNAYEHYFGDLNQTLDYKSPRDKDGHGTHTASTVAGRRVANVSALGGLGLGTASGGAQLARLAIYKACWAIPDQGKEQGNTCLGADMLAAMDDAIADGVDILTLSIGTRAPLPYPSDAIAIGALHAVEKNIVVVCSAGNNGPSPATLSNPAPWIMTVGASSLDRAFLQSVLLGNGKTITGQSATPYKLNGTAPLVNAAQVVNPDVPHTAIAGQCLPGSLSPEKTKGKIVLCFRGNGTSLGKGIEVKRAGGVGFILGNTPEFGDELWDDVHFLPATAVTFNDASEILNYISFTQNPQARLEGPRTDIGIDNNVKPAPYMASFSSRGPNLIFPDILKPDITAPGVNILAAWSEASSPTKMDSDLRVVKYNLLSGTSMSCPHVAGAAALLRAIQPTWSSAAIRSALMTSAGLNNNRGEIIKDESGNPADPFQFGAGHFRPEKAADPGLVYDASYEDYLLFLCSNGVQDPDPQFKCPKNPPPMRNLNYPSLAITKLKGTVTVNRTVTNVGTGKSVYFSHVEPPPGFSVEISPAILLFNQPGEKRSFQITVEAKHCSDCTPDKDEYSFGWYIWNDGTHTVHSPLAVSLA